ncbi:MAG: diguanylate cyclase [Phycisphaerae bacterium]|nr:diguanylate cyclase [Phycisphaerae bacterium]
MQPGAEPKPTVLLIDDSIDTHRLLRARLKHEAMELLDAFSGEDGLATAKQVKPSLILLDLDMPGMDGFTVLRQLKGDSATATIPVVVLSGTRESEDRITAFDLGAADFITKNLNDPADLAELRARLRAALRMERLLRLLSERAEIDGLTGLGNRAQFNRRFTQELAENQRYGHPFSLAVFDADHFKKVNDTFGHPAGDEVLVGLGKIITASCRQTDVPCRFGGEEFALIMPNTTPADAKVVCERIRQALQAQVWPRHPEHQVTCSAGIAGADGATGLTAEQLLEAADKALYEAKKSGRNRVVLAEPVLAAKGS